MIRLILEKVYSIQCLYIMSSSSSIEVKTVAWDPKSPATLLVPTIVDDTNYDNNGDGDGDGGQNNNMVMNYMLCDSGVGCNTFESSAIMNLLDARDAYLERKSNSSGHLHRDLRQLSKQYRKALANCINEWSDDLGKRREEGDEEEESSAQDQQQQQDDGVALELLRMAYAVTQLSETFLLLPSSSAAMQQQDIDNGNSNRNSNMMYVGLYEDNDTWNLPGAVTADTIRYLRLHHLYDAEDLFDPSVMEELNQLWQPDQYGDDDDVTGKAYWDLVEAYLVRGCLEDAWAVLSHHSIVRRFVEMEEQMLQEDADNVNNGVGGGLNDYQAASLAEDREGFRALKSILLSAPLPGARNNLSDEGFDDDNDNDNDNDIDNENNTKGNDQKGDARNANNNNATIEAEEEFIEGVPTSAYCLWETSGKGSGSSNSSRTGDYPVNFEPNAAYQVYRYWKQAIDSIPALQRLRRRIPQLNKLLALLSGNFRDMEFGSWQEELCAELLYKNPNIRLVDMNVRAAALVQKHSSNNDYNQNHHGPADTIDEIVLTIMKGNAGEVVKVMHEFGGGSGAALPAVMVRTVLYCVDRSCAA